MNIKEQCMVAILYVLACRRARRKDERVVGDHYAPDILQSRFQAELVVFIDNAQIVVAGNRRFIFNTVMKIGGQQRTGALRNSQQFAVNAFKQGLLLAFIYDHGKSRCRYANEKGHHQHKYGPQLQAPTPLSGQILLRLVILIYLNYMFTLAHPPDEAESKNYPAILRIILYCRARYRQEIYIRGLRLFASPRGAFGAIFQDNTLTRQFIPDAVGLRKVLTSAGFDALGDQIFDGSFVQSAFAAGPFKPILG